MRTKKQIEALVRDGRMTEGEALQYIVENYGDEADNLDKFPVKEAYCEVSSSGHKQSACYGTWACSGEIIDWAWERNHFSDGAEKDKDGHIYKKIYFEYIYQVIDGKIKIIHLYEVINGTYDIVFNDDDNSNSKGLEESLEYCKKYIQTYNGTSYSYFADYKGGTVSVVCNENGETVYQETIK